MSLPRGLGHDSIPLASIHRQLAIFLHLHQPLHCPRLVPISRRKIGVVERCSAIDVILARLPILIDILLGVMMAEPATYRLCRGQWILLGLFEVLLPFLPILEPILLRTRSTLKAKM